MSVDEIEAFLKEVDTEGDGYIHIAEMAERLCPSKDWVKI